MGLSVSVPWRFHVASIVLCCTTDGLLYYCIHLLFWVISLITAVSVTTLQMTENSTACLTVCSDITKKQNFVRESIGDRMIPHTTDRQCRKCIRAMMSPCNFVSLQYDDVIMGAMASQITSLTVVYSTAYSGADQRKHQSSASLAFVRGNHGVRWIPRTNGQ